MMLVDKLIHMLLYTLYDSFGQECKNRKKSQKPK